MDRYKAQLATIKTMQLATISEHGPWVCTVYFIFHNDLFYWLSEPHRRHSQEIAKDPRVAIAIVINPNMPVVGVQAEGEATLAEDPETVQGVMARYIEKYGVGQGFHERFVAGTNKHQLFCFVPKNIQIFDESNQL